MAKAAAAAGTTTLERLAKWVVQQDSSRIAAPELRQAALLTLDTIGCGIAGWFEHSAQGVADMVETIGGSPRCQVIAAPWKTSVPNAVLANGALCRVLDLNDYVLTTENGIVNLGGHPSDNILVALAFAEHAGSSGLDFLASIVVGYEVFGRARDLGPDAGEWDGVSYSGLVAPAIGGRLLKLDAVKMAHALALSVFRCATSAMARSGHLTAAKSIANALVARTGSEAVLLAERGITGPLDVVEHERGMRTLFANKQVIAGLDAPMPKQGYILQANIKPYPCVATSQSCVAAGLDLHAKLGKSVADIERIRVVASDYPTIRRHLGDAARADPRSKETADHSIPFLIAAAIIDGKMGLKQFEDERWMKPDVRRLMAGMEITFEKDIGLRAPGSYPCRLEAVDKAGNKHVAEVLFPPGLSRGGLDEKDVVDKFHRSTEDFIGKAERDRLIETVMDLPKAPSVEALSKALAVRRR